MLKDIHDSHRTVSNILARIWEIYSWKLERFTKNALTRSVFELQKCSFFLISQIFKSKSLKYGPKMFESVPWLLWMGLTLKHTNFNPLISIFHIYVLSITFLWSRAQCGGGKMLINKIKFLLLLKILQNIT